MTDDRFALTYSVKSRQQKRRPTGLSCGRVDIVAYRYRVIGNLENSIRANVFSIVRSIVIVGHQQ